MQTYQDLLEQAGYDYERLNQMGYAMDWASRQLLKSGIIMARRSGISLDAIRDCFEEGKRLYRLKCDYCC